MSVISKSMKKYNAKSALVIKHLSEKHQVTEQFVRMSIRGDRESETATEIQKDYKRLVKAIDNIIK